MTTTQELPTELALTIPEDLKPDTQSSLESVLRPIFGEAESLCKEARMIVVSEPDDKDGMKKAGDVRKSIKKIRTSADKKRKELKDDAQKTVTAIDGIFRQFRTALEAHEEYLAQQETFAERLEAERLAKVKAERDTKIAELGDDPSLYNTAQMTDEAFASCVAGIKARIEQERVEAEKAEQERIAKEKAEAEERERIRQENERLKKEAEERNAELKREREEREKIEQERREVEEAERKAEENRQEQERKAANAPDKEKAMQYARIVRNFAPLKATSPDGTALSNEIAKRVAALADWIESQAEKL